MKKKYFKSKRQSLRSPEDKMDYKPQKDAEFPKREAEINPDFQKRAFRDLSFNSITVPVNPDKELSYQSDPYAIVNRLNQVVDASYPGQDNLSGSIVPQLAQASDSTFDNVPDSLEQEVKVNIYYCKTNENSNADVNSNGKGTVNLKMDVPYDDIINSITSEAYYDLKFFSWFIPDVSEYPDEAPTYSDDGQLDVLLNYQSIVQTIANIPLRYKVIRSLEKELKDMSYYNGSGRMNRIYGLLKKSSFVSAVKSVSEILLNHYMDEHWFAQISMLVAIPCRKAEDMLNPLIDIIPTYDINENLKVWASKAAYEDDDPQDPIIDFGTFSDLMSNAREFMLHTSPQFLLSLVRDPDFGTDGLNDWINGLTDNLDVIVSAADEFRSQFADLLVAFKRMSKVGITDWKTGFYLPVDKIDESYQPKFNKLAYDIIRASYTGSVDYKYIYRTGQWECHDAWDKYLGIASYSYKSGGCALLASTRTIVKDDAPNSSAVPVLFYGTDENKYPKATILTRKGNLYELVGIRDMDLTSDPIAARVLGRLVPISGLDEDKFIIPQVDISSIAAHPKDQGWVDNLLNNLLPYHRSLVQTAESEEEEDTFNYSTSPDALCFIDVEIEDQTNAVETYVRQHSPFRVVKTTTDAVLGFTTSKK